MKNHIQDLHIEDLHTQDLRIQELIIFKILKGTDIPTIDIAIYNK